MKKRIVAVILAAVMSVMAAGCGGDGQQSAKLEGSCEEILNRVYETAELDADLRDAMEQGYYETSTIDEGSEEYLLGTTAVEYTDSACSLPFINAVAYQCIVLRLADGEDVEAAKQELLENADPIKWVCVEAESVVVENVGDVVLYVMADAPTADAIKTAFLSLGE